MKVAPALTLEAQLKRKVRKQLRMLGLEHTGDGGLRPASSSKEDIRRLHHGQRVERLRNDAKFIASSWPRLRAHFADGLEIRPARIKPILEVVASETWESDLFRLASLTWSIPVSRGFGRRLRFLVWDADSNRLIGILALTDPVFNLGPRDRFVGWNSRDRTERLVHSMDAFVLGAVPPFSMVLGGKLIASLIRTVEIRDTFRDKYSLSSGIISKRGKSPQLAMVSTTSALGRSSLYNRLSLKGMPYLQRVGVTQGWGHFHIPDALFNDMRTYLNAIGHPYATNNRFGHGPNWRLRTIREALRILGLGRNLVHHGVQREVFVCEIADNARSFLCGKAPTADYTTLCDVGAVGSAAVDRWITPRAERDKRFLEWRGEMLFSSLTPKGVASQNQTRQSA